MGDFSRMAVGTTNNIAQGIEACAGKLHLVLSLSGLLLHSLDIFDWRRRLVYRHSAVGSSLKCGRT